MERLVILLAVLFIVPGCASLEEFATGSGRAVQEEVGPILPPDPDAPAPEEGFSWETLGYGITAAALTIFLGRRPALRALHAAGRKAVDEKS